MALRFRPVDTAFYDLFTESAQHLVVGAGLLAEASEAGPGQPGTTETEQT